MTKKNKARNQHKNILEKKQKKKKPKTTEPCYLWTCNRKSKRKVNQKGTSLPKNYSETFMKRLTF